MKHVLLCVVAVLYAALASQVSAKPGIPLVDAGKSCSVIVYPHGCSLSARTAKRLSDYIREQTDVQVALAADDQFTMPGPGTTIIILDGTTNHNLAAKCNIDVRVASERADAYRLVASQGTNGSARIIAAGRSSQGMKYAVYRLMRELEITNRCASIRPLDVKAEPFIKNRSVALFNVWGMPIELTRRHNTESWSLEALEKYIDMYDFYGFNAIESHDRFNDNYLEPLFGLKRAEWCKKVQHMCDYAHQNGQEFYLRIWGHVVMQTPKVTQPLGPNSSVPKKLRHLCVNDPDERKQWENEILKYYVTNYAGRIDNLIGHWCDPGVCRENGCSFKTPLELQMELHRAFKAIDPDFTSSFNLWFFDRTKGNNAGWARGGWTGYENDRDLINAGILDKDVIISTATTLPGSYQDALVKEIIATGHRPAVWTWYRADHEVRPTLHIHLHERLGDYFRQLPKSARQLEWHNIERNVHSAANTANYYVAGRLMWDPSLSVDDLLSEFLTFAFGMENVRKIMPAYLAIEEIRCHSCCKNWEDKRMTGTGTGDPLSDSNKARAALSKLATVRIDPNFRPRIPLDVAPKQIIGDLKASLEVIADYAECRAAGLPAIESAIRQGEAVKASKLLDALDAKCSKWIHTLEGRQEGGLLERDVKRLRKQVRE